MAPPFVASRRCCVFSSLYIQIGVLHRFELTCAMRALAASLLALCLAQGAMAAKTQQVAYSPQGAQ
jgi:hypothetical protein